MKFEELFEQYYNLYRAEADTPASTEDEYVVAIRLANEAINRWASYDNTMWLQLYTTLLASGDGDDTIVDGVTEYAAPADFVMAGGDLKIVDTDGKTLETVRVIPPEESQFMADGTRYAYFTGNPQGGITLNLGSAPSVTWVGKSLNYVYYRKPSKIVSGNSRPEMTDPYFMVNRMLANRFRSSRNPYYSSAKADAEDALRMMQLQNNSGNIANPWSVMDRSGSSFGG